MGKSVGKHSLGRLRRKKDNIVVNEKEISISVWTLLANITDFGFAMLRSCRGREKGGRDATLLLVVYDVKCNNLGVNNLCQREVCVGTSGLVFITGKLR
jgi:hypothetical protein